MSERTSNLLQEATKDLQNATKEVTKEGTEDVDLDDKIEEMSEDSDSEAISTSNTPSLTPPSKIYLDSFDVKKVKKTLAKYGVAIIRNYYSNEVVDQWFKEIKTWLISISDGLTENEKTWTRENLPFGPRLGMMQGLVSHNPTVWKIRESMHPMFKELWDNKKLYTSIDGATMHPYIEDDFRDWPHIDQTIDNVDCIQGQVVLSDTTSSFRCTPCSHLYHNQILDMFGKRNDPSNWLKFNAQMMKKMEEAMPKIFKYWQVPIHSPRGSVIFWKSNTIHSAKLNDKGDFTWRGVVYVSMRPAEQYSKQDRQTLTKAALNGLTTNHWGNSIFAKRPGFGFQNKRSPSIEKLTNNPELLVLKRDEWTPLLLQLTGQPPRLSV